MFFDESYSEQWYRSASVQRYCDEEMDALIVVGTALQTALAHQIVMKALRKDTIPVIEVNLESCIPQGFRVLVKEPSEVCLPVMCREIKNTLQ